MDKATPRKGGPRKKVDDDTKHERLSTKEGGERHQEMDGDSELQNE